MQFYVIALAVIGVVAADVSHLQLGHADGYSYNSPSSSSSSASSSSSSSFGQYALPGGDSSSYQPEHLIPQHLKTAHVESASAQIIPGEDSSSYQPAHLIPQHLKETQSTNFQSFNLGADTQTPEQFIPEADRIAHAQYVQQQEQSPVVIGANTITPAHLYQEPVSNGIEEFNAETHVPVVIGRDTVTPAHLLPKYSVGASSRVSVGHDTQYGSNGGYVY